MSKFLINDFSGGIADSPRIGIKDSCARLENINIHDDSRSIVVNQAMKKISSNVVTDFIIKFIQVGSNFFAFGNSGCVYYITGETVTKVYTDSNGAILDAGYFYGYLYWTTADKLGRCIATSTTVANWTANANNAWQNLTSCSYHSLYSVGDRLFIGNKRYIAVVSDAGVFLANALDIKSDWTVRTLSLVKPLLLIGIESNGLSKVITWNFIIADESYEEALGFEEGIVDGFQNVKGIIYATAGNYLYWFDGITPLKIKELDNPVSLNARTVFNGKFYFATKNGVYSWGRKNKNYPTVLNLEYLTSQGAVDKIGALLGNASQLYVGWQNGIQYLNCEDTASWSNFGAGDQATFSVDNVDFKEGVGSLKFSVDVSTSINNFCACNYIGQANLDISAYSTGKLTFWIYLDAEIYANLNANYPVIHLFTTSDANYIYFNSSLVSQLTGAGWNYIELDLASPDGSPGSFDFSDFDYIRFGIKYDAGTSDFVWKLDDIQFINKGGDSAFGIDIIDNSNKQTQGIIESLVLDSDERMKISDVKYFFDKLPENTSIQIKYKTEKDADFQAFTDVEGTELKAETENQMENRLPANIFCKDIQFQILLNCSVNKTPTFKGLLAEINSKKANI